MARRRLGSGGDRARSARLRRYAGSSVIGLGRRARGAVVGMVAVLALLASTASASAAPFSDGSFETPVVAPGVGTPSGFPAYNDFDSATNNTLGPWVVTAGSVDLVTSVLWQAADGVQSVDMYGTSAGTLCQTYDSNSPGNGAATFSLSHYPPAGFGTVSVLVNGAVVGTFTHNAANTVTNMMYETHTVTFPVAGPTTTLCFKYIAPIPPTGGAGAVIDAVALVASADLAIAKTGAPNPVLHGQNVNYTLTVTNPTGPNTATAPTVTDTLPAGQGFVSSDAACTAAGTPVVVTCNLMDLPSGSTKVIHITASTSGIPAPLYGPLVQTNTATVSSITTDPTPGNNTATFNETVVPAADLTLSKSGTPNPVIGGQDLVYTLTAGNLGPDPALHPTITDTLPAGEVFDAEASSPGCSAVGSVVTCVVPTTVQGPGPGNYFSAGATATFTIAVTPTNTGTGPITDTNTATISSATADPNLANNTATATATVSTSCTQTITGNHVGTIIVPSGTFLCLNGATQTGAIDVDPGGALTLINTTVKGAVETDQATFVTICGSTFPSAGAVLIQGTRLLTRVGDDDFNCPGNHFVGSVTVENSVGGVEVFGNTIQGALTVTGNTSGTPAVADNTPEVEGNTVGAAIECQGNVPAPVNDGLTNTATGAKLHQCATL